MFARYDDVLSLWVGEHCSVDSLNVRLRSEEQVATMISDNVETLDSSTLKTLYQWCTCECFDKPGVPRTITNTRFGSILEQLQQHAEELKQPSDWEHFVGWVTYIWTADVLSLEDAVARFTQHGITQPLDCTCEVIKESDAVVMTLFFYLRSAILQKQAVSFSASTSSFFCYPWTPKLASGLAFLQGDVCTERGRPYQGVSSHDTVGVCSSRDVSDFREISHLEESTLKESQQCSMSIASYVAYCLSCEALREYCNILPQEVDCLLALASQESFSL